MSFEKIPRRAFLTSVATGMSTLVLPKAMAVADITDLEEKCNLEPSVTQSPNAIGIKSRNFSCDFADDVRLNPEELPLLSSVVRKLQTLANATGSAKFNLIDFDTLLRHSKYTQDLDSLTAKEINFLDSIFHRNASDYGFMGSKVSLELTGKIKEKLVRKIPGTGHYLFAGDAEKLYERILKEIGPSIYLTSGIRGVVKQLYLFLLKTEATKGNLSCASRSLAPPGYSYHGVGDFDVGKLGLGSRNFTAKFARTQEFQQLATAGFVSIRYPEDNLLGVRYEPWHVRVVKS